ncbi:MAG: EAL domain-containing protein [Geminicoccaceae bacterium]
MAEGEHPDLPAVPGLREAGPARWAPAEAGTSVVPLEPRRRPAGEPVSGLLAPNVLRLLVVDGCEDDVDLLRTLLARAADTRFQVECATVFEAGLRKLVTGRFDVCMVDHALGGRDGLEFLRVVRHRGIETPVIVTGTCQQRIDLEAVELGAADFIDKEEFDVERLERAIRFAVVRQRSVDRLDRLAQYDDLTGLANRALFGDRLERALASARRRQATVAVMLLDLNGFKPVNDRLGHGAGDRLLRIVADRLVAKVRETDTVARLGGDEFALVIEGLAKPEHASLVARKLLEALLPPIALDGHEVAVTASVGVALFPQDADQAAELRRLADAAMYRAKAQGGNVCRFHDPDLDRRSRRGAQLDTDLRRALDHGELALCFQPQMTLRQGDLGIAAQPRWRHPELGIVDALRIRTLAEDGGLLEPMTDWLIEAVCAQVAAWRRQGLPRLHVAIPLLSRRQLGWSGIAARIRDRLGRHALDPGMFEVEIEERLLGEELATGGAALAELQGLGVRIAVDAFGSAGGSLGLLRDARLRTLKLGPALLDGVPDDPTRSTFAAAVIRLGRELGLRVVADGIRSKGQLDLVRREGADAVQAIFQCPPLPAEACIDWLRQAAARG